MSNYPYPAPRYGEAKPGIIPLRPLTLGDIYGAFFGAVRHNPVALIVWPLLIVFLATLLGSLLGLAFEGPFGHIFDPLFADPNARVMLETFGLTAQSVSAMYGSLTGVGIALLFASPLITAIVAVTISQATIGRKPKMAEVWSRALPRFWPLIGWTFLAAGVVLIGSTIFALLIVLLWLALDTTMMTAGPAAAIGAVLTLLLSAAFTVAVIWLAVRLMFVEQAIVVERTGIRQSIGRGWALSRGMFWRLLGITILTSLCAGFAGMVLAAPFTAFASLQAITTTTAPAGGVLTGSFIFSLIGSALSYTLTLVFPGAVAALLYVDSRLRQEGNLAATMATAAAQAPGDTNG